MGGAYSTYGNRRGAYRVLVGKPEGKRPLEIQQGKIKMGLQEVEYGTCSELIWLRIRTAEGLL